MRLFLGLIFTICNILIARTLISLLGLDALALHAAQSILKLPSDQLHLVTWGLSGVIGLIALACWLIFHIDERLYVWWSPQPPIGSFYQANAVMRVNHDQAAGRTDVQMAVELQNSNDKLLEYHCELSALQDQNKTYIKAG